MGIAPSMNNITFHMTQAWSFGDEAIIKLMQPVYYTQQIPTQADVDLARSCWTYVEKDTSPVYLEKKAASAEFAKKFPTCADWVLFVLFDRLYDVHPLCMNMFKTEASKGAFVVGVLSFMFLCCEDPKTYKAKAMGVATGHCEKGVKAVEYGIIGDVLFYTLEYCLGKTVYTPAAHDAWVLVMSSLLRIIVPFAVSFELKKKEIKRPRYVDQSVFYQGEMREIACPFTTGKEQANETRPTEAVETK